MRQRIREELPRSTTVDTERITRAIITSIQFYRDTKFYFNEATGSFTTTAGQAEYANETTEGAGLGYPDDLMAIDTLRVELAGSTISDPIPLIPTGLMRMMNVSDEHRGYADYYSWHHEKLIFTPIPHTAYDVLLDYVQDVGTPIATYTGGTWEFTEEDGTTTLTDSYTNAWFVEGEELIRLHSKIDMAQNIFKDDADARRLFQREEYILAKLKGKSMNYRKGLNPTPYA